MMGKPEPCKICCGGNEAHADQVHNSEKVELEIRNADTKRCYSAPSPLSRFEHLDANQQHMMRTMEQLRDEEKQCNHRPTIRADQESHSEAASNFPFDEHDRFDGNRSKVADSVGDKTCRCHQHHIEHEQRNESLWLLALDEKGLYPVKPDIVVQAMAKDNAGNAKHEEEGKTQRRDLFSPKVEKIRRLYANNVEKDGACEHVAMNKRRKENYGVDLKDLKHNHKKCRCQKNDSMCCTKFTSVSSVEDDISEENVSEDESTDEFEDIGDFEMKKQKRKGELKTHFGQFDNEGTNGVYNQMEALKEKVDFLGKELQKMCFSYQSIAKENKLLRLTVQYFMETTKWRLERMDKELKDLKINQYGCANVGDSHEKLVHEAYWKHWALGNIKGDNRRSSPIARPESRKYHINGELKQFL